MPNHYATPYAEPAYRAGGLALVLVLVAILTALALERFGGYAPCPLCLTQRYAYYAAIPALFLALVLVAARHYGAAAALFLVIALAFLANAGVGVYHAGAEWKFWPGPDTCSAAGPGVTNSAGGLLKQLETTRVIRCDEAPLVVFGLSLAGWNVVASFLIFIASLKAAFFASEQRG